MELGGDIGEGQGSRTGDAGGLAGETAGSTAGLAGEIRNGPEAACPTPMPPPAPGSSLSALLAGLQAGMVGVLVMLAWLGVSAAWQQRSFWTAENLMASVFYGSQSIHSGFAGRTLPGLALYITIYSTLGAVAGLLIRGRLTRLRTALVCIVLAMIWYYVSFRWMWRHVMPLVALLHAERPTAIGHLLYGLWLGRYPAYLRKPEGGRA
jgi:hypothetical protein